MDFILYYRYKRVSHGRNFPELIKAKNAVEAFKVAKKIMERSRLSPDKFASFYVLPKTCNKKIHYTLQQHGWDGAGSYPRERR